MPHQSSLYLASVHNLNDLKKPDVSVWYQFYDKATSHNIPLIDRSEKVIMPYKFKLYDEHKMPRNFEGFNLDYESCCIKRAEELVAFSRAVDRPILLFYSGGIDSTLMIINFIKVCFTKESRDRITVAMSPESISENPNFYYRHIRNNFKLVSSENFSNYFVDDFIMVGGEHNDQLFGSDIVGHINRRLGFDRIFEDYKKELFYDWLMITGVSEQTSRFWYELLTWHAENYAPCDIKNNFDLLWWLNFNFKWQSVFFRMLMRASPLLRPKIDQNYVTNRFKHFYSTDYFQKWSVLNPHLKIKDSWKTYKYHAKDLIYKFVKDEVYSEDKLKIGSLYKLFLNKRTPIAITDQYEFLYDLDKDSLYQENNTFRERLCI